MVDRRATIGARSPITGTADHLATIKGITGKINHYLLKLGPIPSIPSIYSY